MNLEALKAWRYLHRYLLGLAVLVEIIWILYGEPLPHWKPADVASALSNLGAGEGIILIAALLPAGIIGGTFCELLLGSAEVLRSALARINRIFSPKYPRVIKLIASANLVLPVEELAVRLLQSNLDFSLNICLFTIQAFLGQEVLKR